MEVHKSKLLQRFLRAEATVDGVSSLSHYCTSHSPQDIIPIWFDALRKCDVGVIKPLWYIANDIIQRTKAKSQTFVIEFAKVLEKAAEVSASRAPKCAAEIKRICNIFKERQAYSAHFMEVVMSAADRGAANPSRSDGGHEEPAEQADTGDKTIAAPAANEEVVVQEDAVMERIMGGSLQEALNEAQRRHRISLAVLQLLTNIKPAYKDGTFAAESLTTEATDKVMNELQTAEKHARFALAIARMNLRRRPAIIAKISEALATETEKLEKVKSTQDAYQQIADKLNHLVEAAKDGKTVRARLQGGAVDAMGLSEEHFGVADYGETTGPDSLDELLMADDWQGYDAAPSTFSSAGEAVMQSYDAEAFPTSESGRKRSRPQDAYTDYDYQVPHGYRPAEYDETSGYTAYAPAIDSAPEAGLPATDRGSSAAVPGSTRARAAKKGKALPVAIMEIDKEADAEAEEVGGGAEQQSAEDDGADITDMLGGRVWNPATQTYEVPDAKTEAEESWREH